MTVLINAGIAILLLFVGMSGAYAQEKMIFLARTSAQLEWCGEHSVLLPTESVLIWLDVFSRRQIRLQFSKLPFGRGVCSPDGRWVVVEEGGMNGEGGDVWCDPRDALHVPKVVLWDTRNAKPYSIGTGFFVYAWTADGKTLLYHPWALCNLETDRRTRLRALVAEALKGTPGWVDNGRIGAAGWIGSDRIVAQIPDADGNAISDITPNGAIVLMHVRDGRVTETEQLNPQSPSSEFLEPFRTTLKLNASQIPQSASDGIVRSAGCSMFSDGISCEPEQDPRGKKYFRPNLERYCAQVQAGNGAFCRPTKEKTPWQRLQLGKTVLLLRPIAREPRTNATEELFRVENDEGRYLK